MSENHKFYYQCSDCGKIYDAGEVRYLCPDCAAQNTPDQPPKGVLKTLYHFDTLQKAETDFDQLKAKEFIDLLPVSNVESLPPLKVGKTPMYSVDTLEDEVLSCRLFLKDDAQNPTFSFKDRASYIVSAFAKEHQIQTIIAASTGNAGSSLAGICASQHQQAIILVPESAPLAKLTQIMMYGAQIVPVKGTYDNAFDLSVKATETYGWYNRNTAFNPLTIEGKKTVSFELFDQLGGQVPDRIFVPVGDGVIISGVYKGFEDLLALGIINKMPVIVAVQSEGSDNLVRNLNNDTFDIHPSRTIADSISVDIPRNFYMATGFLKKYDGEFITVSDSAILQASSLLAKNTGLFSEPAAATAFAGFLEYKKRKKLAAGSENVVLLTGSGLKDIQTVSATLKMPEAIAPDLRELKKLLG
jgi:threonine synthase